MEETFVFKDAELESHDLKKSNTGDRRVEILRAEAKQDRIDSSPSLQPASLPTNEQYQ